MMRFVYHGQKKHIQLRLESETESKKHYQLGLGHTSYYCATTGIYDSLCESFSHDCLKHLPRVIEAGPGRRKRTPGHG